MLWIVQNNLQNETAYADFIEALKRLKLDYLIVKPVPFTDKLLPADFDSMTQDVDETPEPDIDATRPIIISGSITLSKMARRRGWKPGTLYNENFNWKVWSNRYNKKYLLNNDAYPGLLGSIRPIYNRFFIRPLDDDKKFTGNVVERDEFYTWKDDVSYGNPEFEYTPVLIATPKTIYSEARMFVVDGVIVTASMYKIGNRVVSDPNIDDAMINFACDMIADWQPGPGYSLDIANTPNGYKIIEIGNICSSGFYAADVQKIIMALEKYYE